jgi:integrase
VRPTGEATRLRWDQVNLADGEIRLEGNQTKTGRPRVVSICLTLKTWLKAYQGRPFKPKNCVEDLRALKEQIGYGTPSKAQPHLKPWPHDVLRHTAISHYFRQSGSYGLTAEQFGNSEAIIKAHYQGRVSNEDTKRFYATLPKKGRSK